MSKNSKNKNRTHRLSIFLLKDTLADPAEAVVKAGLQHAQVGCGAATGELYYRQTPLHPPGWHKFFEGDPVHAKIESLKVASNSAVMLVPSGGRWFALVWGMGRHLLVPGMYEDDFGLRVTLNSLTADQVRSVDHVLFEEHTLQQRAQSSRSGTCVEFGVNVDQNLVKALTGIPTDKTLGVRMTGVDALAVSVELARSDLEAQLARYLARYVSTDYQKHFAWIDHRRPVGDQAQIDALDAKLVDKLRTGDKTRMWITVPEILENEDIESFSYTMGKGAPHYNDTLLPDLLATIKDVSTIDLGVLKHRRVYGHRSSVPNHPRTWSWYRCLYCEIDDGANTYLLYDGRWYRVSRDFIEVINLQVKARVVTSTLPAFDYGVHKIEDGYNKAVAIAQPGYLLLDKDMIHGGQYGQIEVCDLFGLDKRFVHVKRWSSSAALSHLFNQGEVPARLLINDTGFRKLVIDKLTGAHAALVDPAGIKASEFTVTFGVTSESKKPLHESLPLFSRMTFVRVASMLQAYGYNVELMKIDVIQAAAMATNAPPVVGAAPLAPMP